MSSLINLASGLAPAAEISASNDGQDASGRAPDAITKHARTKHMIIHLLFRQDLRQPF